VKRIKLLESFLFVPINIFAVKSFALKSAVPAFQIRLVLRCAPIGRGIHFNRSRTNAFGVCETAAADAGRSADHHRNFAWQLFGNLDCDTNPSYLFRQQMRSTFFG
jgi:hypothetical protein